MIDAIRQLADDMMAHAGLNALVTSDLYAKDVGALVAQRKRDRADAIEACGGLKNALEWGAVSESELAPLNVCGHVSNVLCALLLDNWPLAYRYQFEKRTSEKGHITRPVALSGALAGRSRQKPYLLRVDCDGHSYVVYIAAAPDAGHLLQGNAATSMKTFTFQQWMNAAKSTRALSIREHGDLLHQLAGQVVGGGALKRRLVETFSIDDDQRKPYDPFKGTNMAFTLREINDTVARENLRALYKRARLPVPSL